MQIATSQFYDSSARRMNSLSSKVNDLNTQISTGKKTQSASDDPATARQISQLNQQDSDDATYTTNLTLAGNMLQQADGTLGSVATQLQQALTLAVQAGNGTLSDDNRQLIADQLDTISASLVGLANTKDARGQPLFGGSDGSDGVVKNDDGTFTLASSTPSDIPISSTQSVRGSENAKRIFSLGSSDTFTEISKLSAALRSGSIVDATAAAQTAITNLTTAGDQATTVQSSIGAREARVELQQGIVTTAKTDRAELRSSLEDTDVTSAVVELQKMTTALSAAQATFTKISALSLFDYLK